jgi:uncharacterized RDD family membrane protein YckC
VTEDMHVQRWPGERLGLPEHGPGALAGWGRRSLALVLDWFGSMLVVGAVIGDNPWTIGGAAQLAPLAVFAAQRWLLTSLAGGSFGQLAVRVRVVRTDRSRLDPSRALLRTVLLCLVIPPVVYNRDQRGLHDLAADSMTVRV